MDEVDPTGHGTLATRSTGIMRRATILMADSAMGLLCRERERLKGRELESQEKTNERRGRRSMGSGALISGSGGTPNGGGGARGGSVEASGSSRAGT